MDKKTILVGVGGVMVGVLTMPATTLAAVSLAGGAYIAYQSLKQKNNENLVLDSDKIIEEEKE